MILCLLFEFPPCSKTLTGQKQKRCPPMPKKKIAVGKKFVCRVCSTETKRGSLYVGSLLSKYTQLPDYEVNGTED
jgi:hypothetical protein